MVAATTGSRRIADRDDRENALVDSNTRQAKRTPVTLKVKFKSETLDQFIERYAVDVSQGGIFIRTKEPQPVGTQMKFEFQLRDGAPLIAGEGTVVWIRELDPSRPAVAPGMGVRFDKLSDGSPMVLERILTQKSRLTSGSHRASPSRGPAFAETPTRVAHMPMGDDDRGETTPLPSPIPFQSDADEFSDEAFEEATKVRSVEELVAQTAMGGGDLFAPPPPRAGSQPGRAHAYKRPASTPPFASSAPGAGDRRGSALSSASSGSFSSANVVTNAASGVIEESPQVEDDQPLRTLIDAVPPPPLAGSSSRTVVDAAPAGRTLLDAAPPPPQQVASAAAAAAALVPGLSQSPPAAGHAPAREDSRPRALESFSAASSGSAPSSLPSSLSAVATSPSREPRTREASRPPATAAPVPMVARPAQAESKMTMIIVALVCLLAAAVALVWLLVIKEDAVPATTPPAATVPATPVPSTGSGSSSGGGTAPADGSAAAATPTAAAPAADLAETTIEADYPDASVEVMDSDQRGKAPLVAKLVKGKSYSVKVTAPGHVASELTVIGGNDNKIPVKLDAKPRLIQVNSTPSQASVYVDGSPVKKMTPSTIELTKAQLAKKLRVMVRKVGFQPFFVTVKPEDFSEEADRMVFTVNAAMTQTRAVPAGGGTPPPSGGEEPAPTPSGDGDTDEPKPAEPKPAEPKPAEPAGTGEPAPDWSKNPS
jgi:uncharacterized protein (TIGR02266 family)